MATSPALRAHPRLLASVRHLQRLRETPRLPLLRRAQRALVADAREYIKSRKLVYDPNLHNALLVRAREMQARVVTLLARWLQTGDAVYRQSVIDHIRDMSAWRHWCWDQVAWKNDDPKCTFDLSYGENSATLALAYDWLYDVLTPEERGFFRETALKRSFEPFLARTEGEGREWWFGAATSNWNTVCAGGAGMLALAMHEDVPEAAEVLRRADLSVAPYIKGLNATGGGWEEGVGYWNYGHRYAFWYLLSHEEATGQAHPLLKEPGARQTLDFPLDFCPHGNPCSFGDVNSWSPLAFHYAMAERFQRPDIVEQLDAIFAGGGAMRSTWPNEVELLIFHPGKVARPAKPKMRVAKKYPRMEWCVLADRMPQPRLYVSIRGGTTEVSHGHMDLLSFHAAVGTERLVDNIGINGGDEYLDSTFSARRYDLLETRPESKNTLLVNGVGVHKPSAVETTLVSGKFGQGVRLDATAALSLSPGKTAGVEFCARLFLMLDGPVALVLDRVVLPLPGRMEARLHTYSRVSFGKAAAEIRGRRERLQLAFAATVPATLHRAEDALTTPKARSTMLRWCTDTRTHTEAVLATLLVPGRADARVSVEAFPRHMMVRIRHGGKTRGIKVSTDLRKISAA